MGGLQNKSEAHYDSKTSASIEVVVRNIAFFDTLMRNQFSSVMTPKRFDLIWPAGIKCLMPIIEHKRKGSMLCISTAAQHQINWIETDMRLDKKVQM